MTSHTDERMSLSQSLGLTLPLHEGKDITLIIGMKDKTLQHDFMSQQTATVLSKYLADRALNVSDDSTGRIVQKLNAHLSDVSGAAGSAENLDNLSKLDLLILNENNQQYKF
jgi:hypothetical protein